MKKKFNIKFDYELIAAFIILFVLLIVASGICYCFFYFLKPEIETKKICDISIIDDKVVAYEVLEDGGKRKIEMPLYDVIFYESLEDWENPYVKIKRIGFNFDYTLYISKSLLSEEGD